MLVEASPQTPTAVFHTGERKVKEGRFYQMPKRERPITLKVMVNEEEANLIKEKMELTGTNNFSLYARKVLIDGYVIKRDFSIFKEINSKLGYIARNLHQLAKRANETRSIYAEDVEDIKNFWYKDWAKIKKDFTELIQKTSQGKDLVP